MSRSSTDDRPSQTRPYTELRTWRVVGSLASSPLTKEVFRHLPTCDNSLLACPACLSTTTSIPGPTELTIAMTNYIHAPTMMTRSPTTRCSSASEGQRQALMVTQQQNKNDNYYCYYYHYYNDSRQGYLNVIDETDLYFTFGIALIDNALIIAFITHCDLCAN